MAIKRFVDPHVHLWDLEHIPYPWLTPPFSDDGPNGNVRAHPNVPVILNHMGMPVDRDAAGIAQWKRGLELLATLPHVCVKISGLGFADRAWSVETARAAILETIERFGVDRVAFASDFPTDKLFNTYGQALSAYDQITTGFSPDEREALFATTAERFYRI